MLVLVTLVWGGTFLVTRIALRDAAPLTILVLRFGIGTLALAGLFRPRLRGLRRTEVRDGAILGGVLFGAFALQTSGLQHIPSSTSGFLTALYVPAVPILQLILFRKPPAPLAWAGVGLGFAGLVALSGVDGVALSLGRGEALTIAAAGCSALQIVLLGRYSPTADPVRLTVVQLAVVALLALLAAPLMGERPPRITSGLAVAVLGLGLLGTAFALAAMTWVQRTMEATRATVYYALEPVWAGLFGALAGEPLGARAIAGATLIVAGVVVGGDAESGDAP